MMCPPENFYYFIHRIFILALLHRVRHATSQVFLQNFRIHFRQLSLHRLGLGQNVNTVIVVLHHSDHLIQMSSGNL